MAAPLHGPVAMGKRERATKQVNRLQLRREVIRVLAGDSLAQVRGGAKTGDWCGVTDGSGCWPSGFPSEP